MKHLVRRRGSFRLVIGTYDFNDPYGYDPDAYYNSRIGRKGIFTEAWLSVKVLYR